MAKRTPPPSLSLSDLIREYRGIVTSESEIEGQRRVALKETTWASLLVIRMRNSSRYLGILLQLRCTIRKPLDLAMTEVGRWFIEISSGNTI